MHRLDGGWRIALAIVGFLFSLFGYAIQSTLNVDTPTRRLAVPHAGPLTNPVPRE
jgi:hypothetical protein